MTVDRNLTTPYVWNWTLNLQHAVHAESVDRSRLRGQSRIESDGDSRHQPAAGGIGLGNRAEGRADALPAQSLRPTATVRQQRRPDEQTNAAYSPQVPLSSNIFQMGNVYRSNYNGLQVTLNARNYHGLSMVAGYTYSHALDDVGANWDFGYGSGLPQDATMWARVRQQRLRHPAPADGFAHLCDSRAARASGRCWKAGRSTPSSRLKARSTGDRSTWERMRPELDRCR